LRRDIHLSIKGRVHCEAVRFIPLYGCETWPLKVEDTRKLVFDHCLRNIVRIFWDHRVSNSEVRHRVLGNNSGKSVDEVVNLHRLRWLTLPLQVEDVRRLSVFGHRCLRRIVDIQWQHYVSNAEVRYRVFGHKDDNPIGVTILKHRLQ
uniref:F-box domain-containing protein n=1 Tax=Schistosoma curassoni TaxID=6186 RepID=A0A183KLU8_9TREM